MANGSTSLISAYYPLIAGKNFLPNYTISSKSLLLNFSSVEFLSSAALGKLITLDRKVKAHGGKLKLSSLKGKNVLINFYVLDFSPT